MCAICAMLKAVSTVASWPSPLVAGGSSRPFPLLLLLLLPPPPPPLQSFSPSASIMAISTTDSSESWIVVDAIVWLVVHARNEAEVDGWSAVAARHSCLMMTIMCASTRATRCR